MEMEIDAQLRQKDQLKGFCNSQEERWCDILDCDSSNRNGKSE